MDIYGKLRGTMEAMGSVSCHCHHLPDTEQRFDGLDAIIVRSYVEWSLVPHGPGEKERAAFLDLARHKSYFVWLERSLMEIYGLETGIDCGNWDELSRRIAAAYSDPEWHAKLLAERCRFRAAILDAYWAPGEDDGRPQLFKPSYRIDDFLGAWAPKKPNANGNSFHSLHGRRFGELDELVAFLRESVFAMKSRGAVALKSAIAYERGLEFQKADARLAASAIRKGEGAEPAEVEAFQSHLFFAACGIAAEAGLPFQIHTGLGQLRKTRALGLVDAIEANPDTKFVLFHGSYPWMDDIAALVHNFPNVYPDLCWLPLISTSRAVAFVKEMVELGTADKLTWGCDAHHGEESYGALLAARHVLAKAFSELVAEDWMDEEEAADYCARILDRNPRGLYGV
ncbi:MAG: amidohydrolase family protein [Rectinemataceae bacterium]|jgi:hypothetical protein